MEVRILFSQPKFEAVKCTVHGEPYKLRSPRSGRRLGSTPSTATMPGLSSGDGAAPTKQISEVRFLNPAPLFEAVTQLAESTTFNRVVVGSTPTGLTRFYMSLNRLCLVLNASYEAINVTSARRALTLVFKGAAVVEEVSAFTIRTAKINVPVPSVVRLMKYRRMPRQNRAVSRKGILLRDGSACQYCGARLPSGNLTLDHVVPRSRRGPSTWENLVACCFPCNNHKGNRTPQEAGMTLARQPRQVSLHAKHKLLAADSRGWDKYLFA